MERRLLLGLWPTHRVQNLAPNSQQGMKSLQKIRHSPTLFFLDMLQQSGNSTICYPIPLHIFATNPDGSKHAVKWGPPLIAAHLSQAVNSHNRAGRCCHDLTRRYHASCVVGGHGKIRIVRKSTQDIRRQVRRFWGINKIFGSLTNGRVNFLYSLWHLITALHRYFSPNGPNRS